jgi:hypothetical protein
MSKVTLEVDGVATESKTFEVRADPQSAVPWRSTRPASHL